jgi:hypothetical protein
MKAYFVKDENPPQKSSFTVELKRETTLRQ